MAEQQKRNQILLMRQVWQLATIFRLEKKTKKSQTLYFCVKDYPKKGGRVVEVILAKVVQLIYDPFQVIYTYF